MENLHAGHPVITSPLTQSPRWSSIPSSHLSYVCEHPLELKSQRVLRLEPERVEAEDGEEDDRDEVAARCPCRVGREGESADGPQDEEQPEDDFQHERCVGRGGSDEEVHVSPIASRRPRVSLKVSTTLNGSN